MVKEVTLVLGGAGTVWDDIEEAKKLFVPKFVVAINDIGSLYQDVDAWVTMHPDKMPCWIEAREKNKLKPVKEYFTARHKEKRIPPNIDFQVISIRGGGSGMLATLIGLGKTPKVVLAGVPLEAKEGHYFNKSPWKECFVYRVAWERNPDMKNRVRSVSGWTKEFLGYPDEDWLKE